MRAKPPSKLSVSIRRDFLKVGLLRGLSLLLAGAFVACVAIVYPPDAFGQFSLIFSIVQIFCTAILGWPNQAFLRFGREEFRDSGALSKTLSARLTLHFFLVLLLCVLAIASSRYVASQLGVDPAQILLPFLAALLLVPVPDLGLICAQTCGRFSAFGWAPIIQRATQLLAIGLVLCGLEPTWELLLWCSLFSYLASGAIAWRDVPAGVLRWQYSTSSLKSILHYSWTMPLATLGAYLLQWMDLWFIRSYLDEVSVGHYAWAYTFTLLVTGILVPLAAVLAPKAIDMQLDNHVDGLKKLLQAIFSVCILSGALLPIMVATMALIGAAVVPEKYLSSWPVVLVLSAALLCQMGMAFVEPVVYAQERLVPRMALIVVVMVLVKAAANVLLIERIGMIGSAVATVTCYGVGMLLQWQLLRRHLGRNIPGSWPILAAALATMAFAASWQEEVGTEWFFTLGGGLTIGGLIVSRQAGYLCALPVALEPIVGRRIYRWLAKA